MKKALLIGNNDYDSSRLKNLTGCVNDVINLSTQLSTNSIEGTMLPNFVCRVLDSDTFQITREKILKETSMFFENPGGTCNMALLHFSGHGSEDGNGGHIVAKDSNGHDKGVRIQDIIDMANNSTIPNIIILLDCCYSGNAGNQVGYAIETAVLKNGLSIISASSSGQTAAEINDHGIFTSLICEALRGGGADVLGNISVASLYYFVDMILGPFEQRPIFKSHVSNSVILRQVDGKVTRETLNALKGLFPMKHKSHSLDPFYEPDKKWIDGEIAHSPERSNELEKYRKSDKKKENLFSQLQDLEGAGIIVPDDEKHMFYAAINSKSCSLSSLGKFYWELVKRKSI